MIQSKRMAALALASVMLIGSTIAAYATGDALVPGGAAELKATPSKDYSIKVNDKEIIFTQSGSSATYATKDNNVTLQVDDQNDFLVCFYNQTGVYKGISLGSQKSLEVNGTIASLTLDASLGNGISVTLPAATSVSKLKVANKGQLDIFGSVASLTLTGSANVHVKDGAVINSANTISSSAKLTVESGATVKRSTTQRSDYSSRRYYDDRYDDRYYDDDDDDIDNGDKLPITLRVNSITVRVRDYSGDDVYLKDIKDELEDNVTAYYYDDDGDEREIRGRVTWDNPNKKIIDEDDRYATSYSCGFKFKPSSSKYETVSRSVTVYVE